MKIIIALFLLFFSKPTYADSYAVVDNDGNVVNVVEWDGVSKYSAGEDITLQKDATGNVKKGWTYIDGEFSPPDAQTLSATLRAQEAISAGIVIASTSTSSLNGTYGLDQISQSNVNATVTYILLNGTFPGGGATMPWVDQNGGVHIWPNVTEFKAFATEFANYVAAVALYSVSNGASGSLPPNTVTIP